MPITNFPKNLWTQAAGYKLLFHMVHEWTRNTNQKPKRSEVCLRSLYLWSKNAVESITSVISRYQATIIRCSISNIVLSPCAPCPPNPPFTLTPTRRRKLAIRRETQGAQAKFHLSLSKQHSFMGQFETWCSHFAARIREKKVWKFLG